MAQTRRDEVESALRAVVADLDVERATDPDRLRAYLHDLLGASARGCRTEIDALVTLARREDPVALADGQTPRTPAPPGGTEETEVETWARTAWARVLSVEPTVLPPTVLPPPSGSGSPRTEAPGDGGTSVPQTGAPDATGGRGGSPVALPPVAVPRVRGQHDGAGSAPIGPAGPGDDGRRAAPVPAWRRRAVLVGAGALAALALTGAALALTGDDDGSQAVVAGPPPAPAGTTDPTPTTGAPGPSPEVTASALTDCPSAGPGAVEAEFDVRRGLDLHGAVTAQEHRDLLTSAPRTGGLAVQVADFITVGPAGPTPEAVRVAAGLLPAMVENLADGRAVASEGDVCLQGSYVDEQARAQLVALTDQLRSQGASLTVLVDAHPTDNHAAHEAILQSAITLALQDQQIPFVTGSAELLPEAAPILDRLAHVMNVRFPEGRYPGLLVTVEGHTDDVGSRESNLALSLARAESVRGALVARGVPAGRLKAVGHGPDEPLTTNVTEEGRQTNRRVVFNVGKDHGHGVHGEQAAPPGADPAAAHDGH